MPTVSKVTDHCLYHLRLFVLMQIALDSHIIGEHFYCYLLVFSCCKKLLRNIHRFMMLMLHLQELQQNSRLPDTTCVTIHVNPCAGASNGSSSRKLLNNACLGWATSYGQCGGTQCPSGSNQCSDSAYLCCPEDFSCQRFNDYYWSCFPEDSDISVPTAAPAPAPSGMFGTGVAAISGLNAGHLTTLSTCASWHGSFEGY